ncbi:uroporphyrinogen-III synthase [Phaeovibrio sulfidiphilus]|uniref:Uroporphyrinogen-III synthase n=1 Tax=Phaeovibrio sulfidiphilus TaxID=1220600 RepID=A0A8J7CP73_9PROT|nr:uroporphyrinogen-III synthase [Phaeovibrio sulfidiphilus]MBE1236722.1 uroporphyrinogen-III synthase [Phaeovibrio sulfidiphilus]
MRALITRPRDDAERVAAPLRQRGVEIVLDPLLSIRFHRPSSRFPWQSDPLAEDVKKAQALIFTSLNGVRAFSSINKERSKPVYTVGDTTANLALEMGFKDVKSANGDVNSLAALIRKEADPQDGPLLHASGEKVAGDLPGALAPGGYTIIRHPLYEALGATSFLKGTIDEFHAGTIDLVFLFSPRTAEVFARLVRSSDMAAAMQKVVVYALSPAVARALGDIAFRAVRVSAEPTQDSLLEIFDADLASGIPASALSASEPSASPVSPAGTGEAISASAAAASSAAAVASSASAAAGVSGAPSGSDGSSSARGSLSDRPVWEGTTGSMPTPPWPGTGPSTPASGAQASTGSVPSVGAPASGAGQAKAAGGSAPPPKAPPPPPPPPPSASGQPARRAAAPAAAPKKRRRLGCLFPLVSLVVLAAVTPSVYTFWQPVLTLPTLDSMGLGALDQDATRDEVRRQRQVITLLQKDLRDLAAVNLELQGKIADVERKAQEAQIIIDPSAPLTDQMAALVNTRIDNLTARVDLLASATVSTENMASLSRRVTEVEDLARQTQTRRVTSLMILGSITQMRDQIDRGEPFAEQARVVEIIAQSDDAIVDTLERLRPYAEGGVKSRFALREAFARTANAVTRKVTLNEGEGWLDRTLASMKSVVVVRSTDPDAPGQSEPLAILARAEQLMNMGDLAGAVDVMQGLEGEPLEVAAPWIEDALARTNVEAALNRLMTYGMAEVAASRALRPEAPELRSIEVLVEPQAATPSARPVAPQRRPESPASQRGARP